MLPFFRFDTGDQDERSLQGAARIRMTVNPWRRDGRAFSVALEGTIRQLFSGGSVQVGQRAGIHSYACCKGRPRPPLPD